MVSDVRYEIKTPLPVIWLEIIDTKIRVGPYATNWTIDQLILVDPVEDEDVEETCPRTDPPNVLQCDLKKNGRILTLIRSTLLSIITFYIGFWQSN
jgi:hypothetical protein